MIDYVANLKTALLDIQAHGTLADKIAVHDVMKLFKHTLRSEIVKGEMEEGIKARNYYLTWRDIPLPSDDTIECVTLKGECGIIKGDDTTPMEWDKDNLLEIGEQFWEEELGEFDMPKHPTKLNIIELHPHNDDPEEDWCHAEFEAYLYYKKPVAYEDGLYYRIRTVNHTTEVDFEKFKGGVEKNKKKAEALLKDHGHIALFFSESITEDNCSSSDEEQAQEPPKKRVKMQ
jgi:hypothetical protein